MKLSTRCQTNGYILRAVLLEMCRLASGGHPVAKPVVIHPGGLIKSRLIPYNPVSRGHRHT